MTFCSKKGQGMSQQLTIEQALSRAGCIFLKIFLLTDTFLTLGGRIECTQYKGHAKARDNELITENDN
jgi:hypothetical protein